MNKKYSTLGYPQFRTLSPSFIFLRPTPTYPMKDFSYYSLKEDDCNQHCMTEVFSTSNFCLNRKSSSRRSFKYFFFTLFMKIIPHNIFPLSVHFIALHCFSVSWYAEYFLSSHPQDWKFLFDDKLLQRRVS
jgi:hypothetical protein